MSINHKEVWAQLECIARAANAIDSQDSASEAYTRWLENGAQGTTVREAVRHACHGQSVGLPTLADRRDRAAGMAFLDDTTEGYAGMDRRHENARFPQPQEVWMAFESLRHADRRELATLAGIEGGTVESLFLESCGIGGSDEPTIVPRPTAAPVDCRTRHERENARKRDHKRAARAAARMAAQREREAHERHLVSVGGGNATGE